MDRTVGHQLRGRPGRHLPADAASHDGAHAARRSRLLLTDRSAREGVLREPPHSDDGYAGCLRVARPLSVLHVLGGDADPDVHDHRHLGRQAPDLLGGEVLPVHGRRLAAHAGGDRRARPPAPAAVRRGLLRLRRPPSPLDSTATPAVALRRLRAGLRHQGAAVPAAHVAAGRPRGSSDGRIRDPGGDPPEDGRLRVPALRDPPLSERRDEPRRDRGHPAARADRDRVRRVGGGRAARCQEADRVHFCRPPRIRDAGGFRPHAAEPGGSDPPDGEPRHLHGRPLLAHRHDLRTAAHSSHRRLRRHRQSDAFLRHGPDGRRAELDRPARDERVRGRVPDPGRDLPAIPGGRRARDDRRDLRRRLHASDAPAHHSESAHGRREPRAERP